MSRKHRALLTVLGTLTAMLGFLGLRFMANGHISRVDIVAVFMAVAVTFLVLWVTFRHTSHRQAAGGTLSSRKRKILSAIFVVCLLYCLFSIYGFFHRDFTARERGKAEEGVRKTVRFVRFKAGERDATGWVTARPVDGQFAVMMPDLFNELRGKIISEGQEEQFSSLVCRFQDAKFAATVIPYEEPDKELAERRKDFLDKMEQTRGGQVRIAEDGLYAETYPRLIVEGHLKANDSNGLAQVVLAEERGYMLSVEAQELTDALRTSASRFFQSFEILTPDPNTATAPSVNDAS